MVTDGVRSMQLLPFWIITVAKNVDITKILKNTKGILNLVIKIQDYKSKERVIKYFMCQECGYQAECCNSKDKCAK